LSRISQLTKPDLAFGLRHVAHMRVCEYKDDLACAEHGPRSTVYRNRAHGTAGLR
jgi:hypothetical protein